MEQEYRVKLEKWITENLGRLTDEQLQELANNLESSLYTNDYKDYI